LAGPVVNRARLAVLGVLALAVAGVVVAVVLATRQHADAGPALGPGQLLAAAATLTPPSHLFATPVHVRVDAVVDRTRIDPDRVVLDAHWAPYQPTAPFERSRTDVGSISRLRWVGDIHCVILDCAPEPCSAARRQLRASYVRYRAGKGDLRPAPVRIAWPQVTGFSRLDPIHLQRNAIVSRVGQITRLSVVLPPWQVNSLPVGSDSRRISPTALMWLSLVLAAALVAAAFGFARPWLPAFSFRRRHPPLSRLERALVTVERSPGDSEERRKALELLAEELRSSGRGTLAWTATELAWSASLPESERTAALTAKVRRELERRSNGHRV
jgi:hypothetical protein